jgi:hypothetical protein
MGRLNDSLRRSCTCCLSRGGRHGDEDDDDDDGPTIGLGPITYDKPSPGTIPKPTDHYPSQKKPLVGIQDRNHPSANANGKGRLSHDDVSESDDERPNTVHSVKTSDCGRVTASLTTLAPSSGIVTSGLQPLQVATDKNYPHHPATHTRLFRCSKASSSISPTTSREISTTVGMGAMTDGRRRGSSTTATSRTSNTPRSCAPSRRRGPTAAAATTSPTHPTLARPCGCATPRSCCRSRCVPRQPLALSNPDLN